MDNVDERAATDDEDGEDGEDGELYDPGYQRCETTFMLQETANAPSTAPIQTSSHAKQSIITPDLVMAQQFLDLLERDSMFHFQSVIEQGPGKGGKPRVLCGTLAQCADELTQLNRALGAIWVQVNRGKGRLASDVTCIRSYFVDCDKAAARHYAIEYFADVVVETSPGKFHYYWLTANAPLDQFKIRQQALVDRLDGDKRAVDLSRVMRMPGFFHMKDEPFMSRIVFVREGL